MLFFGRVSAISIAIASLVIMVIQYFPYKLLEHHLNIFLPTCYNITPLEESTYKQPVLAKVTKDAPGYYIREYHSTKLQLTFNKGARRCGLHFLNVGKKYIQI